MSKKRIAVYGREECIRFRHGQWEKRTVISDVEVMAVSGRYAMVRHKGAAPFVTLRKTLLLPDGTEP